MLNLVKKKNYYYPDMDRQTTLEAEQGLLLSLDNGFNGEHHKEQSPPITFTLVLSAFVIVCATFTYGCVAGYSSPAESGIVADLGLTTAQYSVFGSVLTIGGMVGAVTTGKLADFIGRRGALLVSQISCVMGWFAIALAKNVWWIYIGRLVQGFGLGIISYAVPIYIAEITPKDIRGTFLSTFGLALCFGSSLMFFVGSSINWRILALIGSASGFIQIVGIFLIPESPRWLEMIGREKEFEVALQRLRGTTADISQEVAEIKDKTEAFQRLSKTRFLDLFQKRYAHSLTVGVGLMALQQFCGPSVITFYASEIFKSADFSTSFGSKSMAIIQIPFNILALLLIDKSGRRPLLLVSVVGMGLSLCLIGVSFLMQDLHYWTKIVPVLVYVGIMGHVSFSSVGMGVLPWIITSEIFPITVKGSAGSLVSVVNWFCCWIATYSFSFILNWSSTGTFFAFAVVCGLTVIFVAKVVPETKGRTLEEIQASMTHLP